MPRITLAHWYGDKAPGETLDVDEVTAKAMRRDGLVAQPGPTPRQEQAPAPVAVEAAQPQPSTGGSPEAADTAQPSGRRRR